MDEKVQESWGKKNKRNQSRLTVVNKPTVNEAEPNKENANIFRVVYSRSKKWINKADIKDRIIAAIIAGLSIYFILFLFKSIWFLLVN